MPLDSSRKPVLTRHTAEEPQGQGPPAGLLAQELQGREPFAGLVRAGWWRCKCGCQVANADQACGTTAARPGATGKLRACRDGGADGGAVQLQVQFRHVSKEPYVQAPMAGHLAGAGGIIISGIVRY